MKLLLIALVMAASSWPVGKTGQSKINKIGKIDSTKLEQCHYRYPDGTRCKNMVWKPAKFCPRHRGA